MAKSNKSKKYLFWVVLALVLIGAGAWYWWSQKPPTEKSKENDTPAPTPTPNTSSSGGSGSSSVWSDCLSEINAWNKFWDYQKETFFRNQTLSKANRSKNKCQTALLQTILNKQAGAKLTVDGDYGTGTEAAVMAVFNKKTVTLNDVDQKYKITNLYGGSAAAGLNLISWLK
jgi:hypothetical protein